MAKAIMIQGTMSNVGKSLITAALCRIFKQDGYRVAPFKSQNMALNSFITEDFLEMGRAQVMQAEAAGIKPQVQMNPILLKPNSDMGSQVIVNGEVIGNMSAREYYKRKKEFIPDIIKAYNYLAENNDIIVIEGAGSPAEINLNKDDIVNMGMAKLAKAPVLLVGDIDRGGVFAQLLGTLMLLTEEERSYVKGLIINKFRGDKTILEPGLSMLYERCRIKVMGVVPYVQAEVDDEDSLSGRFVKKDTAGAVDIAVIRTPRISNFTDFNILEGMDGVSVRYVKSVSGLGNPDIVMLAGTKNTVGDLLWLREQGFEGRIRQHAEKGGIVFGICGGYQMLGESICDLYGVETEAGREIKGIGLLPIKTVFENRKIRTRVRGQFKAVDGILSSLCGLDFEGYEIHMGVSTLTDSGENMNVIKAAGMGTVNEGVSRGSVYGTYVHGIFDSEEVALGLVKAVLKSKGLNTDNVKGFNIREFKERQYDILANAVRGNLDMSGVYGILEKPDL